MSLKIFSLLLQIQLVFLKLSMIELFRRCFTGVSVNVWMETAMLQFFLILLTPLKIVVHKTGNCKMQLLVNAKCKQI